MPERWARRSHPRPDPARSLERVNERQCLLEPSQADGRVRTTSSSASGTRASPDPARAAQRNRSSTLSDVAIGAAPHRADSAMSPIAP